MAALVEIQSCSNSICNCAYFYSPNATGSVETLDDQTETESVVSFRRERPRHRESMEQHGETLVHTKTILLILPPIKIWHVYISQTLNTS